jgi:PucR C-terminal helix-turn-helix domain
MLRDYALVVSTRLDLKKRLRPELIQSVIEELEARLEDIVAELMVTYRDRIPSYAEAPPEFIEEVRSGTTVSYRVGLQLLQGEGDPGLISGPLEELGRRRAEQGIPLGDTLLAWQISVRTFWRHIIDLAPGDPAIRADIMILASEILMELLEQAVSAISKGYLDVERARVADEELDSQTVVQTLAGIRDRDELFDGAMARLGVDPGSFELCVVARVGAEDIGATMRALRTAVPGAVAGRIDEYAVAFCPAEPDSLSVAPIGCALAGDGSGFAQARAALKVAIAMNLPSAAYEEVAPLALILDAPPSERVGFVRSQLGALLDDGSGAELLRSLGAYYAAGQSVAAAARDLHIHRHTLEYRLERIEKLLGPGIKDPTRRLLLELALTLHRGAT